MLSEHDIQNLIRLELSKNGCKVFRTNVGKVRISDGRYFDTGLPKGHPDLYGYKRDNGKAFYIEVKDCKGKARKEQKTFHEMLEKDGIIHGIARSPEDALKIVKNELVGYGF